MSNILIIDDEDLIREILSAYLKELPVKIFTASNHADAFKIIEENEIDVAICDIIMPGMDGLEMSKKIMASHPHTQIIIITGHGEKEEILKALRLGVFDFIAKPVNKAFLLNTVKNALEMKMIKGSTDKLLELLHEALGIEKELNYGALSTEEKLQYLKGLTAVASVKLINNRIRREK